MPVKCFTKKTKKGKSYTTCSSPGKKKKKKRRTKKEVSEARSMGKEDKPKRKTKKGGPFFLNKTTNSRKVKLMRGKYNQTIKVLTT